MTKLRQNYINADGMTAAKEAREIEDAAAFKPEYTPTAAERATAAYWAKREQEEHERVAEHARLYGRPPLF